MTVLFHSLNAVYETPNTPATSATFKNRSLGQCLDPTKIVAAARAKAAMSMSPVVQCTIAYAMVDGVLSLHKVYRGSCNISQTKFKAEVSARYWMTNFLCVIVRWN